MVTKRKRLRCLGIAAWLAWALGSFLFVPHAVAQDTLAQRLKACAACHGDQGRVGPDGYFPRIAGKPAGYLYNQMRNFVEGRRQYPIMRRMMTPLSAPYQSEIAEYFAGLHLPYAPPAPVSAAFSPAQLARGQRLALHGDAQLGLPACKSCHGEQLMGTQSHVPGLLGLSSVYVMAQLTAWRDGRRQAHAPDCMADVARALEPADIASVSAWLSSQPVPPSVQVPARLRLTNKLRCGSAPELEGVQP